MAKLNKQGKDYAVLADVTDIVGVRVVTQFADQVDQVGELIGKEFTIDPKRSVDKRKELAPDQFGYLSVHCICALSRDRLSLAEYSACSELRCEIQVRSILQHAWAELAHDLSYKALAPLTPNFQRRFALLAASLEELDGRLVSIRNDAEAYAIEPGI